LVGARPEGGTVGGRLGQNDKKLGYITLERMKEKMFHRGVFPRLTRYQRKDNGGDYGEELGDAAKHLLDLKKCEQKTKQLNIRGGRNIKRGKKKPHKKELTFIKTQGTNGRP